MNKRLLCDINKKITAIPLIATLLLGIANVSAEEKKFKEDAIQEIAITLANQTVAGGYKLMKIKELKRLIDNHKDFVLIDAHPRREFVEGYIDGAKNFGFQSKHTGEWDKDIDVKGGATLADYRKLLGNDLSKMIVVYCGFTKCGRSHNAAWWARFLGYTNVYRAPGGITAWKDAGYPYKTIE